MLANSVYKKIFPDPRGVIGFVPMASGIGGQLAEYGACSLMRSWGLKFEIIPGQKLQEASLPGHISDLLIAPGDMGEVSEGWIWTAIGKITEQQGLPVTVLPRSFSQKDPLISNKFRLWVCERQSLGMYPQARLAPDVSMCLRLQARKEQICRSTALYLSQAHISRFVNHPGNFGDPDQLCSNFAAWLDLIAPYQHVVTDRLRFAICAMLMGRKVTLLPDQANINFSMWDIWLQKQGCLWSDDPHQACKAGQLRGHKPVNRSEDFYLDNEDRIFREKYWRLEAKHDDFGIIQHKTGERLALDNFQYQLLRELGRRGKYAELKAVSRKISSRPDKASQLLAVALRRLFDRGVIGLELNAFSLHTGKKAVVCGGKGISPIEVTLFDPVCIGNDILVFADVYFDRVSKPVWFRVNKMFKAWIANPADCMLLCLFQLAMALKRPLWIKNGHNSVDLLRNIEELQHIWSLWHKQHTLIPVYSRARNLHPARSVGNRRAIACFSGGVDSSFTLFNHSLDPQNLHKQPVSHVLLVHGFDIPVTDQASFQEVETACRETVSTTGRKLVIMATNIRDLELDWQLAHGACAAAAMQLLANKFSLGLIPATLNYGILYPWGSTHLTDPLLSSDSMWIKSDGAQYTRVAKIAAMKRWKTGMDNLRYCWKAYPAVDNCGECSKCIITAAMLVLTKSRKNSLKPFPSDKKMAHYLLNMKLSRLDRSDFREADAYLKKMPRIPAWLDMFTTRLKSR